MSIRGRRLTIIVIVLLLAGCSSMTSSIGELSPFESTRLIQAVEHLAEAPSENNTLTIWSPKNFFTDQIEAFNERFPHVEVEVVEVSHRDMVTRYMQAIGERQSPDVILMSDSNLGSFSGIEGFVNVLEMEASDAEVFERIPAGLLYNLKSFHENTLFAVPMIAFPYVTFYRADILEEAGFLSDPQLLGQYISEPTNWLQLANELKENDQYILESVQSFLHMINRSTHYFDEQLEYIPAQGAVKNALEMTIQASEQELALPINIWDANGQQALQDEELVMFYAPAYLQYNLKEWVPIQSGKWQVTSLPFGMIGFDREAGLSLAISSESDQIDLAWEFVKLAAEELTHTYAYEYSDPFFGEQDLNEVFRTILDADLPGQPTPLDHYASELWELHLYKFMMGTEITEQSLAKIEADIADRIRIEKRMILNFLQK